MLVIRPFTAYKGDRLDVGDATIFFYGVDQRGHVHGEIQYDDDSPCFGTVNAAPAREAVSPARERGG